ncbi:MAG: response regulator [Phycisphaerae bacterium]|nr:response regulator [Phycisphaerae bacterium]
MNQEVVILIAEDDEGHFALVKKNLVRAGIFNEVVRFTDGQEVLDFLFKSKPPAEPKAYLLLLDIRMPKVDGATVLERLKGDDILKRVPVIVLTTTDDPREVERCHGLGCSIYIVKPVEYDSFVEAIRKVGMFLSIVSVPKIGESD